MKNKMKIKYIVGILLVFFTAQTAFSFFGPKKRIVELEYSFIVTELPEKREDVAVWVPIPKDGPYQKILDMEISAPFKYTLNYDNKWGNKILYFKVDPSTDLIDFSMRFVIERTESGTKTTILENEDDIDILLFEDYLKPSRMAVIDDKVMAMSGVATEGKTTSIERSRGIYDYVLDNLEYSKKIPGWGEGNVKRLCLAIGEGRKGTGNCTDFHSFFGSLMRAQKIPVLFEMGFPLSKSNKKTVTVEGGYHCWAKFFVHGLGWVPVDISEADKNPEMKNYYFGNLSENRVLFSRGRDITLDPPQNGAPLNFFGPDPYIEIDGEPFTEFKRMIKYKDLK